MEALRSFNLEFLRGHRYAAPESGIYRVIEIFAYGDHDSQLIESQRLLNASEQSPDNLFTFLRRERPDYEGKPAIASLRLVEIGFETGTLEIDSSEHLEQVLDIMKIDSALLSVFSQRNRALPGDGFELTDLRAWSGELEPYSAWSYVSSGYILWSYVAKNVSTRAVLFRMFPDEDVLPHLQRFSELVYHPAYLNVICFSSSVGIVDVWLGTLFDNLDLVECQTGHAFRSLTKDLRGSFEKIGLADLSKKTGSLATGLHNLQAQVMALQKGSAALSTITEDQRWHDRVPSTTLDSVRQVSKEMKMIGRIEAARLSLLVYRLTENLGRAGVQLNVLFNLIAKEDADASIELAKDSKTVALAARNDSSSMKTVAVMTMLFLPATFFAALFAMPLFQWNASPIMQDRFWVYCAFTLPTTIAIFAIFFLLEQRTHIRRRAQELRERAKVGKRATGRGSSSWQGSDEDKNSGDTDNDDQTETALDASGFNLREHSTAIRHRAKHMFRRRPTAKHPEHDSLPLQTLDASMSGAITPAAIPLPESRASSVRTRWIQT